jgi:hypothetical protein
VDVLATTYEDVCSHFLPEAPAAQEALRAWRSDPDKRDVVPFVEHSETRLLYSLAVADVEEVCRRTEHALGDVKRSFAESIGLIVDWHPSFAFEHVLHHAEETIGRIPTWNEFRYFSRDNANARTMLFDPATACNRKAMARYRISWTKAREAMRWRVGNAYLAHLKQAFVAATLREAGYDVRYHVLADVLFRVDFWIDRRCIALYVGNPKFRAGLEGRKRHASELLAGSGLKITEIQVPVRREFGTVHLPSRDDVLRAAQMQ